MEELKNEKELTKKLVPDDEEFDDLDSFIEKRKIQNEALKKLIPENGKKQNIQEKKN